MRKLLIIQILVSFSMVGLFSEQTITDMAGRTVTLKESNEITGVFTSNTVASIFMYTVDPSLLLGWNTKLSNDAKKVLDKDAVKLKNFGTLYGNGKSANDEEVLKTNPSFILLMGERGSSISKKADELTARLKLPVVVLYSDLKSTVKAYKLIGEILGLEERCSQLASYAESVLTRAEKITSEIDESDKKRVYYSLETTGLKTYPAGSLNSSLIELCGGINVIDLPNNKKFGTMTISFEEILMNRPEVIVAGSFPNREMRDGSIFDDAHWEVLKAEVLVVPRNPFNIFEKPPSVNRIAGVIWLQSKLYPELTKYDTETEMKKFQTLFYGIE